MFMIRGQLALIRAYTSPPPRGGGGRRDAVLGYGMYGVWYAIGVTATWCR